MSLYPAPENMAKCPACGQKERALHVLQELVDKQAQDAKIWFNEQVVTRDDGRTVRISLSPAEVYLQDRLRELHFLIEDFTA